MKRPLGRTDSSIKRGYAREKEALKTKFGGTKKETAKPLISTRKNSCTKTQKSANSNVVRGVYSMSTNERLKKVEATLKHLLQLERQRERTADETLFYLLTGKRARQ